MFAGVSLANGGGMDVVDVVGAATWLLSDILKRKTGLKRPWSWGRYATL